MDKELKDKDLKQVNGGRHNIRTPLTSGTESTVVGGTKFKPLKSDRTSAGKTFLSSTLPAEDNEQ